MNEIILMLYVHNMNIFTHFFLLHCGIQIAFMKFLDAQFTFRHIVGFILQN